MPEVGGLRNEKLCRHRLTWGVIIRLFALFHVAPLNCHILTMSEHEPCELCGRVGETLTRHHLIPRTRHANKRNQRDFDRTDVKQRIAWLCRPCHDHVHALFSEKTLERQFNSLDSLREHSDVAKFVAWIRKKPVGFKPVSHDSFDKR